uniref:Uncharacterized protein n=1 Tax=Chromera velia CCMP2878 TaxID=1169474 RepID=A0A0G4HYR4_9ALVE|eukprot:Cvel_33670.t1-p1 / transcript=Cvel_33670.t1 / gene=Cvel_33670 / organism=Chromera_velia_CCMP2878 / gene_product=hypothetical protein / transcript_product=hypothetical protein / location=Cvel_scaffold5537:1553-1993(+) / protein_length=147 / sequence_SO=supercontig / SO=protein_coding / is_pseudo=false
MGVTASVSRMSHSKWRSPEEGEWQGMMARRWTCTGLFAVIVRQGRGLGFSSHHSPCSAANFCKNPRVHEVQLALTSRIVKRPSKEKLARLAGQWDRTAERACSSASRTEGGKLPSNGSRSDASGWISEVSSTDTGFEKTSNDEQLAD